MFANGKQIVLFLNLAQRSEFSRNVSGKSNVTLADETLMSEYRPWDLPACAGYVPFVFNRSRK